MEFKKNAKITTDDFVYDLFLGGYIKPADILVNDVDYKEYFKIANHQLIILDSLEKMKSIGRFRVVATVKGGGIHSQAEAIRHGIARALVTFNPDYRKRLRKANFLTRDSRMKERKKFGLKRARKAPQWSKR